MPQPFSSDAPLLSPLWLVRGFPVVAMLLVAAAFLVRNDVTRSTCLGGALGILIGLTVYSFSIKGVILKNIEQPSDVQNIRITN